MSIKELALVSDNTILIESLSDILGSHGIVVSVLGKEKMVASVGLPYDVIIFDAEDSRIYPSDFFSLLGNKASKVMVINKFADILEIYYRQTLKPANLDNLLREIGV